MRAMLKRVLAGSAVAAWLVVVAPLVLACSVPVFRYALERWPADAYHVVIVHEGPLGEQDKALVAWAEKTAEAGGPYPSFAVHAIDRSTADEKTASRLPELPADATLPWVVAYYPRSARIPVPAWSGPLEGGSLKSLIGSPARRELAKRLLKGESAAWVFLESGDKKKDDKAAALLTAELKKMTEALKPPVLTDDPADRLAYGEDEIPLRVAFSVLRVSRADKAEAMFIRMLLHTEEDLAELKDPMAFAVFGRGRALWALVGAGINAENIEETCAFLVGPCACQIKAMCPGVDMLMLVDWDSMLMGETETLPELTELPAFAVVAPVTSAEATPLTAPAATAPARGAGTLARNVALAVGAGIMVLAAAALVMVRGKRS